ncbi:hypothetical protein [Marilutibacter alkalisoli]|uniref:Uncharacterized protein n=1 Tax=Marilutibacter alkalisoli TaxID=2591633 RepID=A0A514BNV6_9GAMM|nr:hypothetical protein [Lysobacter alkalisoli]QDH69078.1 hypothetical protein FKV23_02395 [Lysobacter alkalisoli]
MPPPGGIAGSSFFGSSATIASVVIISPAIDAAFCSAVRHLLLVEREAGIGQLGDLDHPGVAVVVDHCWL